ncbi:MAG: hypothetical protein J0J04_07785 [Microbacterium sp.]|uniref:hypothetical protein n=1 Tax=Microbacterium sp. TaxID=51671 RepID=UPI001ACDD6D2|nr:hypothetical protein [Microbacterium sp.]MBN9214699.1 hypothetical protein [Microbacterium sp.]
MSENTTSKTTTTRRRVMNRAMVIAAIAAVLMLFNLGARVAPGEIAQSAIGITVGVLLSLSGAMSARAASDSSLRLLGRTVIAFGVVTIAAHIAGLVEALS